MYYNILSHKQPSESSHLFVLRILSSDSVFKGHFPGYPVAPGACNLQMIKECAEKAIGTPVRLTSVKRLKMMHPIVPDDNELTLEIDLLPDSRMTAELSKADVVCLKLSATYHSSLITYN